MMSCWHDGKKTTHSEEQGNEHTRAHTHTYSLTHTHTHTHILTHSHTHTHTYTHTSMVTGLDVHGPRVAAAVPSAAAAMHCGRASAADARRATTAGVGSGADTAMAPVLLLMANDACAVSSEYVSSPCVCIVHACSSNKQHHCWQEVCVCVCGR